MIAATYLSSGRCVVVLVARQGGLFPDIVIISIISAGKFSFDMESPYGFS